MEGKIVHVGVTDNTSPTLFDVSGLNWPSAFLFSSIKKRQESKKEMTNFLDIHVIGFPRVITNSTTLYQLRIPHLKGIENVCTL